MERVAENRHRLLEDRRPIRYVSVGLTLDDAQLAQARDLDIRGVALERRSVRESSAGELVAKLIGDVGVDHNGLLGAELRFDDDLEPASGYMDYIRDAQGRPMWVEAGGYAMPQRGSDVRLSIDLAIQKIAIEELERGMEDADSAGGRVVVADPMTGEVLAMADLTRDVRGLVPFDGELATKIKRGEAPAVRFVTLPEDPGKEIHPALSRNRCVEDVYEPGSTFKSFMWAEVLQREKVRPDEMFNTHNGLYKLPYGRRTLNDVTKRAEQTWLQVLINSSNIGMAQGTARMSFREMREAVLRFGFGSKTDIGLPGESAGIVTNQRNWSDYTQTSVAMGHEVAVTPVQMVRAFSVFARDGELAGTLPVLTLRATDDRSPALSLRRQVIDAWIAQLARETMVDVFDNMVRMMKRNFPDDAEPAFVMFGKSGTAEIPRPDGRGYFEGQYNSSFILGAPVERPRVVVLVVIDDPGPEMRRQRRHYGSQCAGPVAARVAERVLRYMGVAPQTQQDLADASTMSR
ncbi:penicillin-binding protein 2 [Phycisphaerales bacterium ac7]